MAIELRLLYLVSQRQPGHSVGLSIELRLVV
jgi:hypothetical protein